MGRLEAFACCPSASTIRLSPLWSNVSLEATLVTLWAWGYNGVVSGSTAKAGAGKHQGTPGGGSPPGPFSAIAIDGPGAAGKTTVGRALAVHLGYRFLDTGLMYRAVTWLALQQGVSLEDTEALAALARSLDFLVTTPTEAEEEVVLVEGRPVLRDWLRSLEVEERVSEVSALAGVREALVAKQRALAQEGRVVMVGRDIGTNVLPDAPLKVYLDASPEERARRRYLERRGRGEEADPGEARRELERRDRLDKGRQVAPLRIAEDAKVVLTDGLSVEEVTELLLKLAWAHQADS
ncbi:MAG: (d)CMP kinase [Dehalococcoidia bacterium]|nr:(d)CMP kinase [Dehalococcoidia bacterium]